MVRVRVSPGYIDLPLRVIPRARRDELAGERNNAVCVRLTAPPVDGAANKALAALLSKLLGVAKSDVQLVSGDKSREKMVRIATEAPEAILAALRASGIEADCA